MSGQVMKKRYYRIVFQLTSAMSVGSGKNERADKDIVLNSLGKPYIPATALAGVYKDLFCEEEAKKYFGDVEINRSGMDSVKATESRLIIYDGNLMDGKYSISVRDCVGLDEWKTAVKGAKFDFEILEPRAEFVTYVEENIYKDAPAGSCLIADAWNHGRITVGAKTSRGLGRTRAVSIQQKEFTFEDGEQKKGKNGIEQWLDFDLFDEKSWKGTPQWSSEKEKEQICSLQKGNDVIKLKLFLKQNGPITIRKYTTDAALAGEKNSMPDYEQLVYIREDSKIPVIPGTSWAGAFRHHMLELDKNCIGLTFGKKASDADQKNGKKSDITFSESEITGARAKILTRNGIDRFTGGAADQTLFTEKMYYGGSTVLEISFRKSCSQEFKKALAASIADLHIGILSIGGETSVGHGLFQVTSVRLGENKICSDTEKADEIYRAITGAIA